MIKFQLTDRGLLDRIGALASKDSVQLDKAEAAALNELAKLAADEVLDHIAAVFDRPKPSTLKKYPRGPLFIKFARSGDLQKFAEIKIKDEKIPKGNAAVSYLSHNIYGGPRPLKRSEILLQGAGLLPRGFYAVPGSGARLDQYGNISLGQIQQILSFFQARIESKDNTSKRTKNGRALNKLYFLVRPGLERTRHLFPGIWTRNGAEIKPVLIFVQRAPNYRTRFRFFEVIQASFGRNFQAVFDEQIFKRLIQ